MKICTKCGLGKGFDSFTVDRQKKDGHCSFCKECYRAYYAAVRGARLAKKKEYREENSIKISAYRAEHYAKNRVKAIEYSRLYAKENPLAKRVSEAGRRAKKRLSAGNFSAQDLEHILQAQKHKCACCRTSLKNGYHADHIQPLSLGGANDRYNIQALCPTCNMKKKAKDPYVFMQSRGYLL